MSARADPGLPPAIAAITRVADKDQWRRRDDTPWVSEEGVSRMRWFLTVVTLG